MDAHDSPPADGAAADGEDAAAVADRQADLLDEINGLIAALESYPDPLVGEQVGALLEGIDAIHRVALTHLIGAIQSMAGDAFMNRLTADPAIRLLLMSYDLIAVDRRIQAEEALDLVRGHLHAHGIDVELQDVVGGAVYVRLHGLADSDADADAVRRDIESALQGGLVGFQQLEVADRPRGAGPLLQIGGVRRAKRPVHRTVAATSDLSPGSLRAVEAEGVPILLANVGGDVHAVHNRCGDSPLPLHFGTLSGHVLTCSWHGCRYDVRTGRRVDEGFGRLAVYPVAIEKGRIRVALAVENGSAGDDGGAS